MIFDTIKKLAILLVIVAIASFVSKILAVILLVGAITLLFCIASTRTSAEPVDTEKENKVERLRKEVKNIQRRNNSKED